MRLIDYLKQNRLTYAAFAGTVGVGDASTYHKYAVGKRCPNPEMVERILLATDGEVTPNDHHAAYLDAHPEISAAVKAPRGGLK